MNLKMISLLVSLVFLLVSCIPSEQIEEMAIITARGVDIIDEDTLDTTLVAFQFEGQSDQITKILSGKGKTLKGAMNNADLESVFSITPGKIQVELYGMETAQKGIVPLLDTLQRDARVSNTMFLSVSNTTAKEILTTSEENISMNIGQFLHDLIENNATDHNFPKVTLQDFLRVYYDIGKDNALPIIELHDDNIPRVTKIGLFKGDELVGDLSIQEATLLNLLDKTVTEKLFEITLPIQPFNEYLEKREGRNEKESLHTSFLIEKGKSKTKLMNVESLTFQTEVHLDLRLVEQDEGITIKNGQVIQLLEKEIKKKMESDFEELLNKTQDLQVDPFGYGVIYRISQRDHNLTRKEWREKYPKINVDFKVNPKIYRHGTTE